MQDVRVSVLFMDFTAILACDLEFVPRSDVLLCTFLGLPGISVEK